MITVRTVRVIDAGPEFLYPWMPRFTFDAEGLSPDERERLREIVGVEALFRDETECFDRFVAILLRRATYQNYVIALEHKSRVRSHVRSYKGLFKDRAGVSSADRAAFDLGNDVDRLSFEIGIRDQYTHLVGIIHATQQNAADCVEWLVDSTRAFMLSMPSRISGPEELARGILDRTPSLPGPAYLNYAKIVTWLCPRGAQIFRMAGFSNRDTTTLQGFARDLDAPEMEMQLRAAVAAIDQS